MYQVANPERDNCCTEICYSIQDYRKCCCMSFSFLVSGEVFISSTWFIFTKEIVWWKILFFVQWVQHLFWKSHPANFSNIPLSEFIYLVKSHCCKRTALLRMSCFTNVMRCAIWYRLYNLKNVKTPWRRVNFNKVAG